MCKSVLHKHATQEFIACSLTRELGIIIKISFTEKKSRKIFSRKRLWGNNFHIKYGLAYLVECVCVFCKIWVFAIIRGRTVCTLEKDSMLFTNLDLLETYLVYDYTRKRTQKYQKSWNFLRGVLEYKLWFKSKTMARKATSVSFHMLAVH